MFFDYIKDQVIEEQYSNSIVFEFPKESFFSRTGYKIVQNMQLNGLLRLNIFTHNDRICLSYDTEGKMPLFQVAGSMQQKDRKHILSELINTCEKIKENGFLYEACISLKPDAVFVDTRTEELNLLYLPAELDGADIFPCDPVDVRLCKLLRNLSEEIPDFIGNDSHIVSDVLSRGDISEIKKVLDGGEKEEQIRSESEGSRNTGAEAGHLRLIPNNSSAVPVIDVPDHGAVIGRKADLSQIVIPNNTISGKHCRIWKDSMGWYIEDLGSSNGTWINGSRLEKGEAKLLAKGAVIGLSSLDFTLEMGF